MTTASNGFEASPERNPKSYNGHRSFQSDPTATPVYATHHPPFRFDSEWFIAVRDECESRLLDDKTLDDCAMRVREAYAEGRASIWTRFATAIATSKLSGLGGTENSIADRLEIDRSVVNVALNHGRLGALPLIDLMSNPFVLYHLFANGQNLRHLMGQNGFIEAAKSTAILRRLSPQIIGEMGFLPYHLLCRDIELRTDEDYKRPLDRSQIGALVASVTHPPVKLIPGWFSRKTQKATRELADKLRDLDFAASYLQSLETNWLEIYVYTFAVVEGMGCDDLWEQS
jgi:hypothetical protein